MYFQMTKVLHNCVTLFLFTIAAMWYNSKRQYFFEKIMYALDMLLNEAAAHLFAV